MAEGGNNGFIKTMKKLDLSVLLLTCGHALPNHVASPRLDRYLVTKQPTSKPPEL